MTAVAAAAVVVDGEVVVAAVVGTEMIAAGQVEETGRTTG